MAEQPIAYAAIAADGSDSIYVTALKEQAETACREYGWYLVPLGPYPSTWQQEVADVEAAFERSGVKPTWPSDEPGNIGPMANAMAAEIELLRGYRDHAESDAAIARLIIDRMEITQQEIHAVEWAITHLDNSGWSSAILSQLLIKLRAIQVSKQ